MQTKKCSGCKEIKFIGDFCKNKTQKDGYAYRCKECEKGRRKKYYKNNKEKELKQVKEYRKNNIEKWNEYMKEYRENNHGKIEEKRKEYCKDNAVRIKEIKKNWAINNLEKVRDYVRKKRVLIKNGVIENINILQVYENHNWICGICRKKINKKLKHPNPKSISLDHIIPISKGGDHLYSNVQPAHLICNMIKNSTINNIQLKLTQFKNATKAKRFMEGVNE